MKKNVIKTLLLPAFALLAMLHTAVAADEYSFTVQNSAESGIKQVLVSEDKETWGKFDIGDGIRAGESVKLVWDASTNNEDCKQWVKAIFRDGTQSAPKKFNFCEEDLVIEFSE